MSPTSTSHSTRSTRTRPPSSPYVKAQAYVRGFLARKAYVKLVKKQAHRARVVAEIVSTEQSYVKSLDTMIEVYLVPLRDDPKKYGISKDEVQIMFANIETIVNLHKEMLKLLEERVSKWNNIQKIGDIFLNYAPFLKMLNGYCSNYDSAITTLTQVRQDRKTFSVFLEKCESTDAVQILPAYLIQPIQRVPRYNLLLEDLIRNTWEWHNDYEPLCNALRAMKQIADHINASLHKSEKANKVVKIQSDLGGECLLVEPHRSWIKDGPVIRVKRQGQASSPVSTSKLWIYLFNDMLVFAGRILLSYRFIEKYPLDSTSIQDIGGTDKFQIASVAAQSAYILAAENEESKNEWLTAITTAIQNFTASVLDLKSEQRKTVERESSFNLSPRDSTALIQVNQQNQAQRTNQRAQSPQSAQGARSTPQNRVATPSALMKFDFANMPVTEGGDEEEEMTFQERRLMFERGLLPQAQETQPRKPPAKLTAKPAAKNAAPKASDKNRDSFPASSPSGNSSKGSRDHPNTTTHAPIPTSPRGHVASHKLPEIPKGIVGELKQKYNMQDETARDEMNAPLLGKPHTSSPPTKPPPNSSDKKKSSCCVIL